MIEEVTVLEHLELFLALLHSFLDLPQQRALLCI